MFIQLISNYEANYIVIIISILIGLIIGSFLNVVIVRYPIILETQWKRECRRYLNLPLGPKPRFNLLLPSSHCPQCKKPIKIIHNIPVVSYLLLRGRCINCKKKISIHYILVELLAAILSVLIMIRYQVTWHSLAVLLFTYLLIVLSFIDVHKHFLPDSITLPTLWLGLFLNLFSVFVTPRKAIFGAILGYGILWIVATSYRLIRRKRGIGNGDFKMLGMIGAWLGVEAVLNTIVLAVFLGLLSSTLFLFLKKISFNNPIPFGPFIAIGGWVTLLWGSSVFHNLFFPLF